MSRVELTLLVDFGTTTSTAALLVGETVRLLKEPGTGSWTWPSAVCLAGNSLLVGTPAERSKRAHPGAYRSEFKRDLGDGSRIPLGDKSFTPQDLVVEVLRAFTPLAERAADGPIRHLVLTVPGSYVTHDPRRDLMIEAGERAGFSEVELLAEPVAAALAPMEGPPLAADSVVLVYDFGGGTFDAAAVRLTTGTSEVLGYGSREHCGGRDIDAKLAQMITEQAGDELQTLLVRAQEAIDSPARFAARRARLDFTDLVRGIKHQLSDAPVASDYFLPANLPIEVHGIDLTVHTAPILQETIDCCREVLASSRLQVDDLTAILLVGGSTRMPIVADTLRREFAVPIRYAEDPGTAVVQGAAHWNSSRTDRLITPTPVDDGHIPLRWDIPAGSGTLLRWLAEPGTTLTRDQPLLLLRTAEGVLARLTCGESTGELADQHANTGDPITTGQWLATIKCATAPEESASTSHSEPHTSVTMPALGESVTEGTVTRWLKQEGERVELDEPLLEVSTDKVDTEIPSPAAGVLARIVVSEDETVEVGAELAVIARDGGAAHHTPAAEPQSAAQAAPASEAGGGLGGGERTPVTMPALGESVTEGTVTRWLKQEGERVELDEPLLEVSTDKVDTEIPAPVSGTLLEITVGEDETVEVGAQLAVIGTGVAGQ
jgi:molecular chaperone DnaK (HSP70)/biotin carboxyl carrier protein